MSTKTVLSFQSTLTSQDKTETLQIQKINYVKSFKTSIWLTWLFSGTEYLCVESDIASSLTPVWKAWK